MYAFKKILVLTDFSPAAWSAVQYGLSLGGPETPSVTLLHVFPASSRFDGKEAPLPAGLNLTDQQVVDNIRKRMEQFCQELREQHQVLVDSVILEGGVRKRILEYLNENRFDLVIAGVNSNGADNHPGSHIMQIIEQANAPVLVIPNRVIVEKALV